MKASPAKTIKPAKSSALTPANKAKPVTKALVKGKLKVMPKATAKAAPKAAQKSQVSVSAKKSTGKTNPVAAAKSAKPAPGAAKKTPANAVKSPVANTPKAPPPLKTAPALTAILLSKPEVRTVPAAQTTLPNGQIAQRAGRPSSRLASLTVPSMAQSVASTAAKASYSQLPTAPLIIPPLPSAAKKDPKLANNWKTKRAEQLTDAELLAMPDSEYMNEKQMAAFRLKLTTLKQEILNSAGETTEHLREDTVVVPDPADRATIEEEHALELRTRDRERKLLKKIEQSIDRIDSGDYGYCDETGEPIGVGRLLARPTATLSLEAQQRRELKQKMFGD
ncbi:MAG: RNA polymerase-binding protein DksA [Rhodoferax sp.]|nr:RNA polymerase-binding protein DksA [Rhodoferax sp.]